MRFAFAIAVLLASVPALAETPAAPKLFPIRVKGKWGFIDKTGKVKIPAKYEAHTELDNGVAMVSIDGKAGMIDESGKVIIPLKFTWLRSFADDRAPAKVGPDECGYLDRTGAWAVSYKDCANITLGPFSEGLAGVTEGNKTRFIDPAGKVIFEVTGKLDHEHSGGLARIKDGKTTTIVDKAGKTLPLPTGASDPIWWFDKATTLAPLMVNRKHGYIDNKLALVIPAQFKEARPFREKRAAVKVDKTWGYIDETGKTVIEPQFDSADLFSEGLAWVKSAQGLAAIDPTGKVVIPWTDKWDSGGEFMHGLAMVRKGTLMGIVDTKGKVVVPLADVQHQNFIWSGDLIGLVDKRGKLFYVNRKNKKVWSER